MQNMQEATYFYFAEMSPQACFFSEAEVGTATKQYSVLYSSVVNMCTGEL